MWTVRDGQFARMDLTKDVQAFWNSASCGENLYLPGTTRQSYEAHSRTRYQLEPFIEHLAQFDDTRGKRVLEIGTGLGADHQRFAQSGAELYGVDITQRAIDHTRRRLELFGLPCRLSIGNAERLPFPDNFFDVVYAWGVLHHTPNTAQAVSEVHRVLRPGGRASVMIYHKWSIVGFMLWIRYALLAFRPWLSLDQIYARHLESPGTKAYSIAESRALFTRFSAVQIQTVLTHADLLESDVGQRHRGAALSILKRLWPRTIVRMLFRRNGLFMLISAGK
jgi:SAM-dependent methyltransferase